MTEKLVQGPNITATEVLMRREGLVFIGEVPAGTRLALFRGEVYVLPPDQPPQRVGGDGTLVEVKMEIPT
jgi:hypothetical protein